MGRNHEGHVGIKIHKKTHTCVSLSSTLHQEGSGAGGGGRRQVKMSAIRLLLSKRRCENRKSAAAYQFFLPADVGRSLWFVLLPIRAVRWLLGRGGG